MLLNRSCCTLISYNDWCAQHRFNSLELSFLNTRRINQSSNHVPYFPTISTSTCIYQLGNLFLCPIFGHTKEWILLPIFPSKKDSHVCWWVRLIFISLSSGSTEGLSHCSCDHESTMSSGTTWETYVWPWSSIHLTSVDRLPLSPGCDSEPLL